MVKHFKDQSALIEYSRNDVYENVDEYELKNNQKIVITFNVTAQKKSSEAAHLSFCGKEFKSAHSLIGSRVVSLTVANIELRNIFHL